MSNNYFVFIKDNKIDGKGQCPVVSADFRRVETTEEIYNNIEHYTWDTEKEEIVINPDYEQEQARKREVQFKTDFFQTSLGWIRKKPTMKNGEKKDFLTDLLPVIALGVNSQQVATIITYAEPDYTQEEVDWESLQTRKQATPQFVQECFLQLSADF